MYSTLSSYIHHQYDIKSGNQTVYVTTLRTGHNLEGSDSILQGVRLASLALLLV